MSRIQYIWKKKKVALVAIVALPMIATSVFSFNKRIKHKFGMGGGDEDHTDVL